MSHTHSRLSVCRRIFHMSFTWLTIGAMVGAIGGLRYGVVIEVVCGAIGGVIVLPIVGVFLGLIGGDAKGSVVGAVGCLMGCWLAEPTGGSSLDPASVEVVVIFGALLGATCLLYLEFVRWSYGIFFRRSWQLVDGALVSCGAPTLASYFGLKHKRSTNTAHFNRGPVRRGVRLTQHVNADRG